MAGQEGSRWAAERVHNEKYVQYSNQQPAANPTST